MYRNLHFLVESATKVEVLYVSTLMLLFLFRQKVVAIFRRKKIKIKKITPSILQLRSCNLYCNLMLFFVPSWKKGLTITQKVIKNAKSQQKRKSIALLKHYNIIL